MTIIIVMIMAMSEITGVKNKYKAFIAAARVAFPFTIPIMAGYVFAGIAFGMLMNHAGFPAWLTIVMCATMISGSGQFLAVDLLQAPFNPLSTLFLIFMVLGPFLFMVIFLSDHRSVYLRAMNIPYSLGIRSTPSTMCRDSTSRTVSRGSFRRSVIPVREKI